MAAGQPFVPTIGVPFQAIQLTSGDGSVLTVTMTVTDAAGRFTMTFDSSGARSPAMSFDDQTPLRVPITPGRTANVSSGTRRWPVPMSFSSA